MRCFIHVVAPEGRLVPIQHVLIGWSMSRVGVHELHGHMAIPRVEQHPLRLREGHGLPVRSRHIDVREMPCPDQLVFICVAGSCTAGICLGEAYLLRRLGLRERDESQNSNERKSMESLGCRVLASTTHRPTSCSWNLG